MSHPKVSIIILNWNGWKDTIECLESLYQITYPNYDVIVVDNGSQDESIQKIKEYCEGKIKVKSKFFEYDPSNKPIKIIEYTREEAEAGGGKEIADLPSNRKLILIKNEKNYGFAEGNNIGIRYALKALNPDYVLLLNNDTVVDKRFLDELVKVAESDEKIGIVGPKIFYYDEPDSIFSAGGKINLYLGQHWMRGNNRKDNGQFDEINAVDFVTGACMLIKRRVVEKTGLIPMDYFLQWEDIDYCVHAQKKAFRCIYVGTSKIWHKVSASFRRAKLDYEMVTRGFRNRIVFCRKFSSDAQFICFLLSLLLILIPTYTLFYLIYYKDLKRVKSLFIGIRNGLDIIFNKIHS